MLKCCFVQQVVDGLTYVIQYFCAMFLHTSLNLIMHPSTLYVGFWMVRLHELCGSQNIAIRFFPLQSSFLVVVLLEDGGECKSHIVIFLMILEVEFRFRHSHAQMFLSRRSGNSISNDEDVSSALSLSSSSILLPLPSSAQSLLIGIAAGCEVFAW